MRSISATETARRLSDILDAVEEHGERFLVLRHGRVVARIEPATAGTGHAIKQLLRSAPDDAEWRAEIDRIREVAQIEDRRWTD